MDLKQIEELMTAMHQSRIKRLAIKREGFEIELERECAPDFYEESSLPLAEKPIEKKPIQPEETPADYAVTSPMVGTFYSAPSPDDPSFVKVGDRVEEETIVCIIEAMKVMNEVKSGVRGTIGKLLVKNGSPLEFGTKMFLIIKE